MFCCFLLLRCFAFHPKDKMGDNGSLLVFLVFKQQVLINTLHCCSVSDPPTTTTYPPTTHPHTHPPLFPSWGLMLSTIPLTVKCLCEHQLWAEVQNKLSTRSPEFSSVHVGKITSVSNFPTYFIQFCFSELVFSSNLPGPSVYLDAKPPLQISINLFPHAITVVLLPSPRCLCAFVISFLSNFSSL